MQYTINSLRMEVFQRAYAVYDIFKDYFGEDFVDLQGLPEDGHIADLLDEWDIIPSPDGIYEVDGRKLAAIKSALKRHNANIIVWWPKVTVTNEFDKSVDIQDLFAKVTITSNGFIPTTHSGFTLNRSTYSLEQWQSCYMHSHISTIPKNSPTTFQIPCTGTGPINNTILSLKQDTAENFDEITWMLFCEELARYVTVESIAGRPYYRLEEICLADTLYDYRGFDNNNHSSKVVRFNSIFSDTLLLSDFIRYYLHHGHLSINYYQGNFVCGLSYFDYIIDVSNSFIEFFNNYVTDPSLVSRAFNNDLLRRCVAAGGKFYTTSTAADIDISSYQGRNVVMFKGQMKKLQIIGSHHTETQITTILSHGISMFILNNILRTINYHYRNEHSSNSRPSDASTVPATTSTSQKRVYYL